MHAENRWGWRCRNSMGGGYGGGARFECTLRIAGAGAAETQIFQSTLVLFDPYFIRVFYSEKIKVFCSKK